MIPNLDLIKWKTASTFWQRIKFGWTRRSNNFLCSENCKKERKEAEENCNLLLKFVQSFTACEQVQRTSDITKEENITWNCKVLEIFFFQNVDKISTFTTFCRLCHSNWRWFGNYIVTGSTTVGAWQRIAVQFNHPDPTSPPPPDHPPTSKSYCSLIFATIFLPQVMALKVFCKCFYTICSTSCRDHLGHPFGHCMSNIQLIPGKLILSSISITLQTCTKDLYKIM